MNDDRLRSGMVLMLSFGAAVVAIVLIARNKAVVEDFIRSVGVFGLLAMLGMYAILGLSPVPADPLTLISGAVFGPLVGGLLAWAGMTLAALVEYYMGTRIADAAAFEQRKRELPWGLDELPVESVWFLIGGRMLTGAGSKVVSFISGIYQVSLGRYLWTTALAMAFGAVLFALGGFGLINLF